MLGCVQWGIGKDRDFSRCGELDLMVELIQQLMFVHLSCFMPAYLQWGTGRDWDFSRCGQLYLMWTQDGHRSVLSDFTEWCDESYLDLNMNKTKEMILDFRKQGHTHRVIQICEETVAIVHSYMYLRMIFEEWDLNADAITKKGLFS